MNKKNLESVIGAFLTAHAFEKKASSWYRQTDGGIQLVDLQKSSYGMQYYLNICCVPSGMKVEGMPAPKEHKCPIRIRLAAACPAQREEIDSAFDLERVGIADSERQALVIRLLEEQVLPLLDSMRNVVLLRESIKDGVLKRGMVNLEAKRHLGIV